MKKNFIRAFALLTLVGLTSACNNSAPKMDEEPEAVATTTGEGMRIAYIEIDTLTAQYEFAKEKSLELEKKGTNARNTIQAKTAQLEKNAQPT